MSAPPEKTRKLLRYRQSDDGPVPIHATDQTVVEEPLQIRVEGDPYAVLMRTPGHDPELAVGFLHGEGILRDPGDLLTLEYGPDAENDEAQNTVDVQLAEPAKGRVPRDARLTVATSSCGVCGRRSIEQVQRIAPRNDSSRTIPARRLLDLPSRLRDAQEIFGRTGGLHAAALFDPLGQIELLREDIGRHNAVDKVVGHSFLQGILPLSESILMVSGRAGFEIVEKAVIAGIPIVCAISAPSSLALELAESADVTVVGFLREQSFNVYTARHRIR